MLIIYRLSLGTTIEKSVGHQKNDQKLCSSIRKYYKPMTRNNSSTNYLFILIYCYVSDTPTLQLLTFPYLNKSNNV